MKRTISGSIAKLACSAFAAAFLFVLPVSAKEATVQNGDIQAALDQAKGSSEAVTVTIPAGDYTISRFLYVYPNTTINANGATIRNDNQNTPILTSDGSATLSNVTVNGGTWISDTGSVVDFNGASNINLKNMTIPATSARVDHRFVIQNATGINLENCTLNSGSADCVYFAGSNSVTVDGGTYTGAAQPFSFESTANVTLRNCNLGGNTEGTFNITGSNYVLNGVTGLKQIQVVSGASDVEITACELNGSSNNGIMVQVDNTVVQNNTIYNSGSNGIYVAASNTKISNNTIENSTNVGIYFQRGANNDIGNNTVKNSGFMGFYMRGDTNSNIHDNTFSGNAVTEGGNGEGVVLDYNCNGTRLVNNTITDTKSFKANIGNGIIVNRCKNVTVEGNTVQNSGNHGIQSSYQSSGTIIKNNTVKNAGNGGISISRGTQADLSGNSVENVKNGIVFDGKDFEGKTGTSSGSITNCTVRGTSGGGVVIDKSNVTMNGGNIYESNGNIGIGISESTVTVENVNVYQSRLDADGYGIHAMNSNVTLNNNCIGNFGYLGIYVQGGTIDAKNNSVFISGQSFKGRNGILIEGTSSTIQTNYIQGVNITATETSAYCDIANTKAGVVINNTKQTVTTNDSGSFSVTYPSTDASKVGVFAEDHAGNTLYLGMNSLEGLNGSSNNGSSNGDEKQIRAFVSRLYTVALGRDAEQAGLDDWTNRLMTGQESGAQVAQGFFFSDEFKNKNLSEDAYVNVLYRTMFDRDADEGGKSNWMKSLRNGMSREFVYHGFAESDEFQNLCNRFGIIRGSVELSQARDQNENVSAFVARIYYKALNRSYLDDEGMNNWTGQILNGKDPAEVVWGFIFSDEFKNRNLNNDQFIKVMYETYFDREADTDGYNDWMNRMNSGATREDVVNGFSGSQEFYNLVKSFGL